MTQTAHTTDSDADAGKDHADLRDLSARLADDAQSQTKGDVVEALRALTDAVVRMDESSWARMDPVTTHLRKIVDAVADADRSDDRHDTILSKLNDDPSAPRGSGQHDDDTILSKLNDTSR